MVSCIGYTNLDISKEMIQNDTLLLKPAVYHLKEVLVKASKKIDRETLGYANSKIKSLLSAIKGMEICTYIENPYHEVKTIHSVLFKIRNPNKTKLGFRLHLYELDTIKKKPSKDLLDQNIIITIENKGKNVIEYDVSAYNLELPSNGAFIGIEWLGELNDINNFVDAQQYENGFIELNDKTDSFTTFQRNRFSIFPWTNMERFKKNAENYQKYNNCPNASFGISIYKE